jgi:hypothetical protein
MPRRIPALCSAGLAAIAVLGIALPAGAQTPTAQTLTVIEQENAGTFNIVDNPPKSRRHGERTRFSVGDAIVINNPVVNEQRQRIGRARGVCFITKPGTFARAEADCLAVFALRNGNLYGTIPLIFRADTSTGTIYAGTGAYQGLHGTWASASTSETTSTDTFTLTP